MIVWFVVRATPATWNSLGLELGADCIYESIGWWGAGPTSVLPLRIGCLGGDISVSALPKTSYKPP